MGGLVEASEEPGHSDEKGYLGEQGAIQYGWIKGCVERWGAEKAEKVSGTSLGKIPDATEGLLVGCE